MMPNRRTGFDPVYSFTEFDHGSASGNFMHGFSGPGESLVPSIPGAPLHRANSINWPEIRSDARCGMGKSGARNASRSGTDGPGDKPA